jgi:hypothetical protein
MRAVLAVSALHLGYHRPDKRDAYTAHAIMLHQKASRSAMKFMAQANIEKDDAVNLFLFSMLTVYFGKLCPPPSVSGCANMGGIWYQRWRARED